MFGWGRQRLVLDASLARWIDAHVPEAGGIATINIYSCAKLPFEWLPGNRSTIEGLTLWNNVYLRNTLCPVLPRSASVETLLHELIHVIQFRKDPVIFPIKYLIDYYRFGYWHNPAEVEARDLSNMLVLRYINDMRNGYAD